MPIPYWRLSSFYFFYFATVGSFVPYWSLYLKDRDFNASEIGELTALLLVTKIFAPNLWGWIGDATGKNLPIIRWCSFFAAVFFGCFFYAHSYLDFVLITLAFSFFWNATLPQFEAVTLFHLKTEMHRYGRIRLWGSIGFIAAVIGIGQLLDYHILKFLPLVITGFLLSGWIVSLLIPKAHVTSQHTDDMSIWSILKRPEVLAFFVLVMVLQIAHSPFYVFYSVYLEQYHYPPGIIGFLWALAIAAEIVLFILTAPLIKHFSLRHIVLASIVLSITRWLILALGADYFWLMVVAQILHAASFASLHVAGINLVNIYFGRQHQGKGQALFNSASFGVGGTIGSLASGYYWDALSPELVFLIAAIISTLGLLIAFLWVGKGLAAR